LLHYGAPALQNRDLLALLLGTGRRSLSALGLADALIAHFGSLSRVLEASVTELTEVAGVGRAKAAQIVAAAELGRRVSTPRPLREPLRSASDVMARLGGRLRRLAREEVW